MTHPAPIRILTIAGSLRESSYNRRLTRLAAQLAPAGVQLVEYEQLRSVEPYDQDHEQGGYPPGAAHLVAAVRAADAVFIATPEYNGSVPGQLKNALDWASRSDTGTGGKQASALFGVPVGVASTSAGQFGGVWARDELVKILRTQGARPIAEPSLTIPDAANAFDGDTLVSAEHTERTAGLLSAIAALVATLRAAGVVREPAV